MKKNFFICAVALVVLFTACNNDEDYDEVYYSIGTLSVDGDSNIKAIDSDLGNVINATNSPKTDLNDGDRAYVQYINLENVAGREDSVYNADFIYVDGILTKDIIEINERNADSIGNDKIYLDNAWFSKGYLNIEFSFWGDSQTHFINMVGDNSLFSTSKSANDKSATDTIYLELRHNAYNDYNRTIMSGLASFRLKSLPYVSTGQVFAIKYKGFDGIVKTKELVYELSSKEERTSTTVKNKSKIK
ncbi:MAG: hypothetical protein ACK5L5_09005 [Bacteroidales bacterium]